MDVGLWGEWAAEGGLARAPGRLRHTSGLLSMFPPDCASRPPSLIQERLAAADRKRQARLEAVRVRAAALGAARAARAAAAAGAAGGGVEVRLGVQRGLSLDEEASTPKRLVMQRMVGCAARAAGSKHGSAAATAGGRRCCWRQGERSKGGAALVNGSLDAGARVSGRTRALIACSSPRPIPRPSRPLRLSCGRRRLPSRASPAARPAPAPRCAAPRAASARRRAARPCCAAISRPALQALPATHGGRGGWTSFSAPRTPARR
jgi:hypothetical protein